jgi:hypothetical protein
MLHDMFVYEPGLRWVQGTKNETCFYTSFRLIEYKTDFRQSVANHVSQYVETGRHFRHFSLYWITALTRYVSRYVCVLVRTKICFHLDGYQGTQRYVSRYVCVLVRT